MITATRRREPNAMAHLLGGQGICAGAAQQRMVVQPTFGVAPMACKLETRSVALATNLFTGRWHAGQQGGTHTAQLLTPEGTPVSAWLQARASRSGCVKRLGAVLARNLAACSAGLDGIAKAAP